MSHVADPCRFAVCFAVVCFSLVAIVYGVADWRIIPLAALWTVGMYLLGLWRDLA